VYLLLQDGGRLLLEDGSLLALESAPTTRTGGLLLQDGGRLRLEDGSRLLLEGVEIPVPPAPEVVSTSGRPVRRRTGFGVLSPLRASLVAGRPRAGVGATSRFPGALAALRARSPEGRGVRNPSDEELALLVAELLGDE